MLIGGTSVLAAAFHPREVWDEMRSCGAVGFAGAGAIVSMLWNLPPDPVDAEVGLRFISASPIAAGMYRAIEERYRCRVVTMYGMTEGFPIAYKAVCDHGKPGTSGQVTHSTCESSIQRAACCLGARSKKSPAGRGRCMQ